MPIVPILAGTIFNQQQASKPRPGWSERGFGAERGKMECEENGTPVPKRFLSCFVFWLLAGCVGHIVRTNHWQSAAVSRGVYVCVCV